MPYDCIIAIINIKYNKIISNELFKCNTKKEAIDKLASWIVKLLYEGYYLTLENIIDNNINKDLINLATDAIENDNITSYDKRRHLEIEKYVTKVIQNEYISVKTKFYCIQGKILKV